MAENETPESSQPDQTLPDYLIDPNAILNDTGVKWRYGSAPDYSKTRKVYEEIALPRGRYISNDGSALVDRLCPFDPRFPRQFGFDAEESKLYGLIFDWFFIVTQYMHVKYVITRCMSQYFRNTNALFHVMYDIFEIPRAKSMNHAAGSLPSLVENLVKNWEVEASFKPELEDWRTIDSDNYSFAINGGEAQTAEHMLRVGTYNAIIAPNDYYSPAHSDFASSHKTFKRMMPTFAWEVLEVYSGPPHVSFRWRHWGTMKNDYTGFNDKGEKITAKAHGGQIDIQGVTIATVDEKTRLQRVETWFDPMTMFRQIAPHGIVNRQIVAEKASNNKASCASLKQESEITRSGGKDTSEIHTVDAACEAKEGIPTEANGFPEKGADEISQASGLSDSSSWTRISESAIADQQPSEDTMAQTAIGLPPSDVPEDHTASTASTRSKAAEATEATETADMAGESRENTVTHEENAKEYEQMVEQLEASKAYGLRPASGEDDGGFLTGSNAERSRTVEHAVMPGPGEAVVAPASGGDVQRTHEEMSRVTAMECPFLMNQE